MSRPGLPPHRPRQRTSTMAFVGLAIAAVLFAGGEFRDASADGPDAIAQPGDADAKALALRIHAELAAMDKLPRFYYRVQFGNADVETMRDMEDCTLPGLTKALDEPMSQDRWYQSSQSLVWTAGQAVWSTFDRSFKNESQESPGDRYRQDRVWTSGEAFQRSESEGRRARFVFVKDRERLWEGCLSQLGFLRVTPHDFWWGTGSGNDHGDTISEIPPELASYRFLDSERFDGELCDVIESPARAERLWIGRESPRLRGVLDLRLRGAVQGEPFYASELVEKMAGRAIGSQQEFQEWLAKLSKPKRIELSIAWNETYFGQFGPNELMRFRDYREVAPGVWIPFREDRSWTHRAGAGRKGHNYMHLWTAVQEVRTDVDLLDTVLTLRPRDGETVQDQRFGAVITYPFRRDRTEHELLEMAEQADRDREKIAPQPKQPPARPARAELKYSNSMRLVAAVSAPEQLESHIRKKIGLVHYLCELSDAQKQKLELAARGDIRRQVDRIAEIAAKFEIVKSDADKLSELSEEALLIRRSLINFSNGDAGLIKVLDKVLTPEQMIRYQPLRALVRAGGRARMDERETGLLLAIMLSDTGITDDDLAALKQLPNVQYLSVAHTRVTDAGLAHLKALTTLEQLHLDDTQVTDAGLAHLAGPARLNTISLENTAVTSAGVAHLKGLTGLRELDLTNTRVSDAALAELCGLTNLERLRLDGTGVTDAGMAHLSGLKKLWLLGLSNTQVTDTGIEHLTELKNLEELGLGAAPVTNAGVANLRQALPRLRIYK